MFLPGRIPGTGEPGGLPSMGSHRVGHDWSDLAAAAAAAGQGHGTPLQYSCLENPMDRGAWWAAVHGVAKSRTWLSNFTFTFYFHALEKEMPTHSSVLAWRIPGMGEPGGLPSIGSHRVGHDWSDLAVAVINKVSRGDGIPVELFQILKDDAVKAALNMSANLENSAVATGLAKVSFRSNPKERQCQRTPKLLHNCLILHASKKYSKSFRLYFNSMWTENFQMYKLHLEKAEEAKITF